MRVLIVEDITLVAERILDLSKKFIKHCDPKISHNLKDATLCILEEVYDLVFLDLNLKGDDGFELLKLSAASSFQTIIITANSHKASMAFDYGVLDFITKPISEERFEIAIKRFLDTKNIYREQLKYLAIKTKGVIDLIPLEEVTYIKASGNYSEIHTSKEECYLHDKNLDKLLKIVPNNFIRVHRSYIIPKETIDKVIKYGGGKYNVKLLHGNLIPLSREMYKELFKR